MEENLNLRDLDTYVFHAEEINTEDRLIWNVFVEDFNHNRIYVHNVFDHFGFICDLISINNVCKEDKKLFEEKVEKSLLYYYWGKSEWEVVVTDWPPHVNSEEIDRLVEVRKEYKEKWGGFYRTDVHLIAGEKIDVYSQVRMNWNMFIDYLWNH